MRSAYPATCVTSTFTGDQEVILFISLNGLIIFLHKGNHVLVDAYKSIKTVSCNLNRIIWLRADIIFLELRNVNKNLDPL